MRDYEKNIRYYLEAKYLISKTVNEAPDLIINGTKPVLSNGCTMEIVFLTLLSGRVIIDTIVVYNDSGSIGSAISNGKYILEWIEGVLNPPKNVTLRLELESLSPNSEVRVLTGTYQSRGKAKDILEGFGDRELGYEVKSSKFVNVTNSIRYYEIEIEDPFEDLLKSVEEIKNREDI